MLTQSRWYVRISSRVCAGKATSASILMILPSKGREKRKVYMLTPGMTNYRKVVKNNLGSIGSFQKTSTPPPQRKLGVTPPHIPYECPNTLTVIRNKFFFPPFPDGRIFILGGRVDLFWNNPIPKLQMLSLT